MHTKASLCTSSGNISCKPWLQRGNFWLSMGNVKLCNFCNRSGESMWSCGSEWSESSSGGSEASGHGCFPWTGVTPSLCAHALVHICTITQVYRTLVWPNLSADFHCANAQCAMHSEQVDTSVTSSYLCWCSCAFSVCNNVNWNERTMKTQNTCDLLWL